MPIIWLDALTVLFSAAALALLGAGWRRIASADIRFLTALLFSITLFYAVCLWFQWAGITDALDRYEDFAGALIPMAWAFLFYAHIRGQMTRDLVKNEENLRVTLDSIADGVIATDRRGSVTRMNPVAERLTGWSTKEAQGRLLTEIFHIVNATTREPVANPVARVLETGDIVGMANHTLLIARGGIQYQIADAASPIRDTAGRVIGAVIVFRDVTEEYRLLGKITENEKRMELALRGADLATWDWHMETGKLVLNERWASMLGYTLNEIELHVSTWEKMIHPEDLPMVREALNAHLNRQTDWYETEHRLKHKNGHWIWVLDKGRVIERDPNGTPVRACGTHLDISERKRHDDQIRQVQKVEAVGRLAGGIAHDLNNLLSPILGYSELLLENPELSDEQRRRLTEVFNAGSRARDLVRQLLAFCRKQTLEFKRVNLNEIIMGFQELLRRTISEDIEIRVIKTPDILPVNADAGQIEQIIMNLAVNAADAMPNGGRLTIETAVCELDQEYTTVRPKVEPGLYVMLAVSDTGCGMDQKIREHIFEPFFSTKGERGTGLGLATVFGIVKQHDGSIWLYSEPGQGTTFKVYLPVAGKTYDKEDVHDAWASGPGGTETILLAEDNEQVRHLAQAILEQEGYTVLTAHNSDEALALLTVQEGPVHLLLTDVVMPGMNGRELYQRAARIHPALKVLYMSGYTNNVIAHRGVLDEGVQFIQKPFSIKGLAAKIREVLQGNDRQNTR